MGFWFAGFVGLDVFILSRLFELCPGRNCQRIRPGRSAALESFIAGQKLRTFPLTGEDFEQMVSGNLQEISVHANLREPGWSPF